MHTGYLLGDRGERDIDAILISKAPSHHVNGVRDTVPFADESRTGPEARSDPGGIGASRLLQLSFVRWEQVTVGEDLNLINRTSSQ